MDVRKLYEIQQSLFGRNRDKIVPGTERIEAAAKELGSPQHAYNVVHVAGTNGKGSTASMIARGLIASGEKVALYTSPHLFRFGERFSINGEIASTQDWSTVYNLIEKVCLKHDLTFFEVSTLIAFTLFYQEKCSWVVLETGMGGRLDATNIVKPALSVISSIGIDHSHYLGEKIEDIAKEKLGIAKKGSPLIISHNNSAKVLSLAQSYCDERGVEMKITEKSRIKNVVNSENPPEICLDLKRILKLSMSGEFQKSNYLLAITALEKLGFWKNEIIYEAAAKTIVTARMQKTTYKGKLVIFDVAHNAQAMKALLSSIRKDGHKGRICMIFGMLNDKDCKGVMKTMLHVVGSIICITVAARRAQVADYLFQDLKGLGYENVTVAKSAAEALERALGQGDIIVVAGSFYTVSMLMDIMGLNGI